MDELSRNLGIDRRIGSYEGFIPEGWMNDVFEVAKSSNVLSQMLMDLNLGLRTTSYTAQMPAAMVKSIQTTMLGYIEALKVGDYGIVKFIDGTLALLSQKISEVCENGDLRNRLAKALAEISEDYRAKTKDGPSAMPIELIWETCLSADAFQMALWSSQRVSYLAFYGAYEAFLVDCLKHALELKSLRVSDKKKFVGYLRTTFDSDVSALCYTDAELNNIRLVRHALIHAGGRVTEDLKKQQHGIQVMNNTLHISPMDNKRMLDRLRMAIETLVKVAVKHASFK